MVRAAGEAEGRLWGAVAAFGWRWVALAGSEAAGGIATVLLAGWLAVWWQRHELAVKVAQWQAQADAWAKMGGRLRTGQATTWYCEGIDMNTSLQVEVPT